MLKVSVKIVFIAWILAANSPQIFKHLYHDDGVVIQIEKRFFQNNQQIKNKNKEWLANHDQLLKLSQNLHPNFNFTSGFPINDPKYSTNSKQQEQALQNSEKNQYADYHYNPDEGGYNFFEWFMDIQRYYYPEPKNTVWKYSYANIYNGSTDIFYKRQHSDEYIVANFALDQISTQTILTINRGYQKSRTKNLSLGETLSQTLAFELCDYYFIPGQLIHSQQEQDGFSFVIKQFLPDDHKKKFKGKGFRYVLYHWQGNFCRKMTEGQLKFYNGDYFDFQDGLGHNKNYTGKLSDHYNSGQPISNALYQNVGSDFNWTKYRIKGNRIYELITNSIGNNVIRITELKDRKDSNTPYVFFVFKKQGTEGEQSQIPCVQQE